jgi:hypothetical protein
VRVYEGAAFWGASVGQPCYSPHLHAIAPLHTTVLSIAHVYGPWLAMEVTSARLELVVCLCLGAGMLTAYYMCYVVDRSRQPTAEDRHWIKRLP